MLTDEVLFDEINGTGWIILNRPQALNALSLQMVTAIYKKIKEWAENEKIFLVCIKSQNDRAFCSGGDVRAISEILKKDSDIPKVYFTTEYLMDLFIHQFPKPTLVYMNGIVMGGGVGLSVGARFRIITEKTRWAMPEMNIGFFPDVGANHFLNNIPGEIGLYLALTSNIISGRDILNTNMADYYIHSSNWNKVELYLKINKWESKRIESELTEFLNFISEQPELLSSNLNEQKINYHFKHETLEKIIDSLNEKASCGDKWAEETRNIILKKSPTSLKLTKELLKRGKGKSLKESFEMDLEVALNLIHTYDFSEGIRAVLVEKDNSPKWIPNSIHKINEKDISQFFVFDWKKERNPFSD